MYVETGRYLRQMIRDVQIAGGKIEVRRFATRRPTSRRLPEALVFNCTGLGSRDLFGDQELHPARGQLAILEPQPEVRYAFTGGPATCSRGPTASSSAARSNSTQWDTTPEPAAIARIVAVAQALLRRLPLHRLKRPGARSDIV